MEGAAGVAEGGGVTLTVTPIDFAEANAYVAAFHRHHKPMPGVKFCVAVSEGDKVRGVAMVGRPVARHSDDGMTLEVNRCCTDGARNACSMLYGAAWRAAKALGYRRLITYTLPEEGGASLRAAGWVPTFNVGGTSWTNKTRQRNANEHSDGKVKVRWEVFSETALVVRPRIDKDEMLAGQKQLWEAA